MRGIAVDETRHAELSWRIAAWLEPQLNDQDRGLVVAARDAALRELEREIAMDALPDSARALIGLPSTSVQRALLDRMASQLALS